MKHTHAFLTGMYDKNGENRCIRCGEMVKIKEDEVMCNGNCDCKKKAEVDLTRAEKEALLWMLRAFRDKAPDAYDETLDGLPRGLEMEFCNGWDKLKK